MDSRDIADQVQAWADGIRDDAGPGHAACDPATYQPGVGVACGCGVVLWEEEDDPGATDDTLAESGRELIERHGDAPTSTDRSLPLLDPSAPYGPKEIEERILDAVGRLERGVIHEAQLVAAAEQAKIEYELAYARAIRTAPGRAADQRKAEAVLACEREYRAMRDAEAARDAMKGVLHSLRSALSGYQSVGRSVGSAYQGGGR